MRTVAALLVSLLFLPLVHSTPSASSHSEPTSDDYDPDDHYVVIRYPIIWDIKDINISAVVDAAAKQTEEEVYRAAGLPPPTHPFPYPRLIDPETAEYKPLPILPDDWVSVSASQLERLQELRAQQPQPPTDPLLLQQLQDLERRLVSRVKFIEQLPKPLKENIAADLEKLLPLLPDDWLKPTLENKQELEQQKEDLFKRTDLSDQQLHLALLELQKPMQQRMQHLQQLQPPLKQALQDELAELAALLTDEWLQLTLDQQQRLQLLRGQSQPPTDPQEREELSVLQHRAAQRILHLQHLQQPLKSKLQQELDGLLPLMPNDWLKLTPEQLKRLAELQQQQPLPEPALKEELWQLQQGLLLRKQYLEDLQKLQPQNLKLQKELDKQEPLLADNSHKLAPTQLERLQQLHQAQPLTDPQEQEEMRVLQQHAELRVLQLQLQQRQHMKSELQQELDDLLPVLPDDWLQLSPLQLQRLKDLVQLHQAQPLTDPQEQEALRVLQQRADLRVQQLEHLQQLLQPGTSLQPELQQELDDLQPLLLPQLPGKRQAARQSAQEPTAVAPATKQLVRARRHLG